MRMKLVPVNSVKVCSESLHSDTDRRCVQISWNVADGKSAKSWVIYRTKKKQNFGCLSNGRYCADRAQKWPKFARASPQHLAHNIPSVIQIGSGVHVRRNYSLTREGRFLALGPYFYDSPRIHSRRIINSHWHDSVPVCVCWSHSWAVQNRWTDRVSRYHLVVTQVGPRNYVLDGGSDPPREVV